jgi:hypothetical protein
MDGWMDGWRCLRNNQKVLSLIFGLNILLCSHSTVFNYYTGKQCTLQITNFYVKGRGLYPKHLSFIFVGLMTAA